MAVHEVRSPAVGNVTDVLVQPGEEVGVDSEIALLESMKMEVPVNAPVAGRIREVFVSPGNHVETGDVLMTIEC